ncbi:hypothetical protein KF840_18765 [bacterium]|nr:hypothetical protein [bacterium]
MVGWGGRVLVGVLAVCAVGRALALSNPNSFCTGDPCVISADKAADPGIVLDFGTRTVVLQKQITMSPLPGGALSSLTIRCGTFRTTGDGVIKGSRSNGPGGTLTIQAVNAIQLNGTTTAGDIRLTGQDGGTLTLTTGIGSISGSGRINVAADGIIASAGTVTMTSAADVAYSGTISLSGGSQGAGGTLVIQAPGNVILSGSLVLTGGQSGGGYLDVTAAGALTINNLNLSGSSEYGDAGLATIDGGTVTIGTLTGLGGSSGGNCGDAADIDIFATGDVLLNGPIDMRGRGLDCSGGFLDIDARRVFFNNSLRMSGDGTDGDGGDLDVSARTLIQVASNAVIDLQGGTGGAGDLVLQSDGDIVVAGQLRANGRTTTSPGATLLELNATGSLTVSGTVTASGGSALVDGGGDLGLIGCKVDTASTARVTATGNAGDIRVEAHDKLTLRGVFQAGSGGISVRYGTRAAPPTIAASFSPATTPVLDPLLAPCRVCESNADCNDGNSCTTDTCSADGLECLYAVIQGACSDGNACTVGDVCVAGVCVGGAAANCDDNSPCTLDTCLPASGCLHVPVTAACDDGNTCTSNDRCVAGVCVGTAANCNDYNVCTDDTCSDEGGCLHTNNFNACNDNNPCTVNDGCLNGVCSGVPAVCNDNDPCTIDTCAQSAGCQFVPIPGCADTDHDGKIDDVDECTTIAWTSPPTTPPDQFPAKFGFLATKLSAHDGAQGMLIKGLFNVPPAALPIDPASNGVHLYAADASGPIFDLSVPGGAGCIAGDGWTSGGSPAATIWKYRNRSDALPPACAPGSAQGVSSVQIKDGRQSSKRALQFKVKAKSATLLRDPDLPLTRIQVDVALGAQPAPGVASAQARAGQCAEALFTGNPIATSPKPSCKTKLKGSVLDGANCKGP